jgi:hypothetical protein
MTNGSDGLYNERRAVPRYMFIATAEIIEPTTNTRMSGRVSEISQHGCYLDILNTLPRDTPIRVRIITDRGAFECAGKIVYVQENVGMGVGFVDPAKDQQEILTSWLEELSGGS